MNILAPSLLAANFANLQQDIKDLEKSDITFLHLDIMDGIFVPNISFGLPVIKSLRSITSMIFDCHLMISQPSKYIQTFADTGADIITFHIEVEEDIAKNITKIKNVKKKAGLAINAHSTPQLLPPYLDQIDMVTVMSVQAGFGGQKFLPESLEKVAFLAKLKKEQNLAYDIQIDGGINLQNIKQVIQAGANIIVAGSSVFDTNDIAVSVENFKRCL